MTIGEDQRLRRCWRLTITSISVVSTCCRQRGKSGDLSNVGNVRGDTDEREGDGGRGGWWQGFATMAAGQQRWKEEEGESLGPAGEEEESSARRGEGAEA